ncbi:hypothetical protein C8N43_3702 [Litoreibacter ponti]|uniref:Uncharacterized protein n=2 Tax=Litoreibacter ponti TaxID=1510457 RepID=A0A2T6BFQ3_9RHOB|nr:hypothetical protein C8N43_3702 [Litoreibacter ponti]
MVALPPTVMASISPAWAEVCDKARPSWDGAPVSALQEAVFLFSTVPALILVMASALVLRFRSQWGGLVVVLLWTGLVTMLTMVDPSGLDELAVTEGCVGSPALFISVVAAICVAIVLYTLPRETRL